MTEQSRQQVVPVAEAVGMVLPHDITEIVKDEFKGRAFRKGHIIRPEDVSHLRRLGKEHIYVLDLGPDEIHENEAALLMAEALAGSGVASRSVESRIWIRVAKSITRPSGEGTGTAAPPARAPCCPAPR